MAEEPINEQPEGGTAEKSYTQKDVDRIMGRNQRKVEELERQLAERPTADQLTDLQSQFEALKQERELEGASEADKLKHSFEREREKLSQRIANLEADIKAKDDAVAAAEATLRDERVHLQFGSALAASDVLKGAQGDALKVLISELSEVTVGDNGVITADYGDDLIQEDAAAIAKRFLADRPHYMRGPSGGAGSTLPNGSAARRTVEDANENELAELAGAWPSR